MCFNASSSTPWQLVAAERMNEWERERDRRSESERIEQAATTTSELKSNNNSEVRPPRRWWRYGKYCCCFFYKTYSQIGKQKGANSITKLYSYMQMNVERIPVVFKPNSTIYFFFNTRERDAFNQHQRGMRNLCIGISVVVVRVLLPALLLILCLFFYTHFLVHTALLFALINVAIIVFI